MRFKDNFKWTLLFTFECSYKNWICLFAPWFINQPTNVYLLRSFRNEVFFCSKRSREITFNLIDSELWTSHVLVVAWNQYYAVLNVVHSVFRNLHEFYHFDDRVYKSQRRQDQMLFFIANILGWLALVALTSIQHFKKFHSWIW